MRFGPAARASSARMGKRNRRHHSTDDRARDRSLLEAIAGGELDDHLTALAEAVDARRRVLLTGRSATALAVLCVGDEVRINHAVSPRELAGLHGTVIEFYDHAASTRLPRPVGRFSTGRVRCPPLALDKLTDVAA